MMAQAMLWLDWRHGCGGCGRGRCQHGGCDVQLQVPDREGHERVADGCRTEEVPIKVYGGDNVPVKPIRISWLTA